jgi:hypothetical protein
MLMLSSLAVAAQDNSQLGPYAVSFDMNTDLPYELIVMDPIQTESVNVYGMQIFTDNSTKARLMVSEYKNPIDSTLGIYKQLAIMGIALNGFNTTSADDITIDGKEGFLITGEPLQGNTVVPAGTNLFQALYWIDSKDCECGPVSLGTTSVDITSYYPQDVTENLIGSLHVEKGQAAPMASAGQDMPPATN